MLGVLLTELGALAAAGHVDDTGTAGNAGDEGEESLEDSWTVMNRWWTTHGAELLTREEVVSRVGGTLLCKIWDLHQLLTGVMLRKAGGNTATDQEESKIYALSLTIITSQATRRPNYGVGFLGYMAALRNVHSITHDHLHSKG